MQRLDDNLRIVHLIFVEHWHSIHRTVRIPCLTLVDPNRKVPYLYFQVVDLKLQVADLKAKVGELRSGGIPPQFNPCIDMTYYHSDPTLLLFLADPEIMHHMTVVEVGRLL